MKKITSLFLAFLVAFGAPIPSYAGYAQLKFPAGWAPPKTIGTPATFKTGPSANQNTYKGSTVLTNAALEIGGQAIQVPVSMRIAANAATVAASYAFGNPLLFATLAVGSAAYQYYNQQGLSVDYGTWVRRDPNICSVSPCYEYLVEAQPWYPSGPSAAAAFIQQRNAAGAYYKDVYRLLFADNNKLTYEWKRDGQIIVASQDQAYSTRLVPPSPPSVSPVDLPKFHEIMDPIPVPYGVPQLLPDVEWPYEQPAINPSPADIPDAFPSPSSPPASRPMWVPTGDPVKNPTTTNPDGTPKPDTWTQPGKDVKPSGTPSDPWRVDVTEAPKTKGDPSPNTDTPIPTTTTPTPTTTEITTCGLPGKPKCLIDETGTKADKGDTLTAPKTALDATENARKASIDAAHQIQRPEWTFSFQLPSGCTPFITGLKGVVLDVCKYREPIHDLLSMVWAGATVFCLAGMVGRTIRES